MDSLYIADMSVDMDVHGYPCIWISMDIHRKYVDMDMDMDVKFHIHGNPGNYRVNNYQFCAVSRRPSGDATEFAHRR